MTDLPELQHLLIEAAGRRSRRRRRVGGARAVALVAAAAVAVVAVPRGASDDVELPAVTPTPAPVASPEPSTIEQAYGVFRRPARATDRVKLFGQARGSETRRVATGTKTNLYLAVKPGQVCVITAGPHNAGTGMSCGATRLFLTDARLHGSVGSAPAAAFAFQDGVHEVTLTLDNGSRTTYPITGNGVVFDTLPARVTRVEWIGGDGLAHSSDFVGGRPLAADELFVALTAPAGAAGELPGLPGSRRVLQAGGASAWLVPRHNAICLVVQLGRRSASGCRQPLRFTNRPLVVGLPGNAGTRVVAAAFADLTTRFALTPAAGDEHRGVLLWSDGGVARTLKSSDPALGTVRTRIPSGIDAFVLNARAQDPKTLPDP
jgi:hypothetical protein